MNAEKIIIWTMRNFEKMKKEDWGTGTFGEYVVEKFSLEHPEEKECEHEWFWSGISDDRAVCDKCGKTEPNPEEKEPGGGLAEYLRLVKKESEEKTIKPQPKEEWEEKLEILMSDYYITKTLWDLKQFISEERNDWLAGLLLKEEQPKPTNEGKGMDFITGEEQPKPEEVFGMAEAITFNATNMQNKGTANKTKIGNEQPKEEHYWGGKGENCQDSTEFPQPTDWEKKTENQFNELFYRETETRPNLRMTITKQFIKSLLEAERRKIEKERPYTQYDVDWLLKRETI